MAYLRALLKGLAFSLNIARMAVPPLNHRHDLLAETRKSRTSRNSIWRLAKFPGCGGAGSFLFAGIVFPVRCKSASIKRYCTPRPGDALGPVHLVEDGAVQLAQVHQHGQGFRWRGSIETDVDAQAHGRGAVVVIEQSDNDNDNDNESLPDGVSVTTSVPIAPAARFILAYRKRSF
jgi:hypothetical protein